LAVFLADPAWTDAVVDALVPWLHEQRDVVELMTFAGDAARIAAFERHGLRHRRSSFVLARSESAGALPTAVFPDGVEVARYTLGDDDEGVHRLIYRDAAWASVPGHAERDLDAWRDTARHCTSAFLARRHGRAIGWVAGRLLASGRGYIDTLAVATADRRGGLGRALLLHGLADLQLAGARGLTLGVEAENQTALGLYRSVDLEVEHEWRIYASAQARAKGPRSSRTSASTGPGPVRRRTPRLSTAVQKSTPSRRAPVPHVVRRGSPWAAILVAVPRLYRPRRARDRLDTKAATGRTTAVAFASWAVRSGRRRRRHSAGSGLLGEPPPGAPSATS
jgi:ribosomal protein S18 acetylase RimI-like enzyme